MALENAILSVSNNTSTSSQIHKNVELGRAIARLYIAAQEGVSLEASNAACDLITASNVYAVRFGFDSEMAKSPYNVRASLNIPG